MKTLSYSKSTLIKLECDVFINAGITSHEIIKIIESLTEISTVNINHNNIDFSCKKAFDNNNSISLIVECIEFKLNNLIVKKLEESKSAQKIN